MSLSIHERNAKRKRRRPVVPSDGDDKLPALEHSIAEAAKQANLAYQFSPGSYTYSALNACLSAAHQIRAIRSETPSQKPLASTLPSGFERKLEGPRVNLDRAKRRPRPAGTKAGPKAQTAAGYSRNPKIPGKCDP
jgi:hypothetical protein